MSLKFNLLAENAVSFGYGIRQVGNDHYDLYSLRDGQKAETKISQLSEMQLQDFITELSLTDKDD